MEETECLDAENKVIASETCKGPDIANEDLTSADISDISEEASLSARLQAALESLSQDTRNALLLEAVQHYVQVKHFRDNLLVRVGVLDPKFAEFLLREREQEG